MMEDETYPSASVSGGSEEKLRCPSMQKGEFYCVPGLMIQTLCFTVPLNYSDEQDKRCIRVSARLVRTMTSSSTLPTLVYLQGGPGFPSPNPENNSGWLRRATMEYQVLLLDQRGTGRSTRVSHETLQEVGDANAQAEYLKYFRADSIVKDCELMRKLLLGEKEKWSVIGQSFGGFCVVTYLSHAPEGLREAMVTFGLPPITQSSPDEVYRRCYRKAYEQNMSFYKRFPSDIKRVRNIVRALYSQEKTEREMGRAGGVKLPSGGVLTVRRFLQLGILLGIDGGMEKLHYMIEEAFLPRPYVVSDEVVFDSPPKKFSRQFLRRVEEVQPFEEHPLYAILHEPIYCQGPHASRWSAERIRTEFPAFDLVKSMEGIEEETNPLSSPVMFTGEMVYSWMFDDYEMLKPLKETAETVANCDSWNNLYDSARLAENTVPCVSIVNTEDLYVDMNYALETAKSINNMKVWVTNEFTHSGLRSNGELVLGRLLSKLRGEI